MGVLSRSLNRNKFQKKTNVIWSWVLIGVLTICCYIGVFHSHRYFGFDIVLVIGIVGMFSIYGLDFLWFDHGRWHKLRSFIFVLLVGVPLTALVIYLHHVYRKNMLAGRNVAAKGTVTKLYVRSGKYGRNRSLYAVFSYEVNGKTWKQQTINSDNPVDVGDTIKLICSELDPEIFVWVKDDAP